MKFLLDAGHGGEQSGAVYGGVCEDDLNLGIVLNASNVLRELYHHDVLLTRDKDVAMSLTDRRNMIDNFKPHAFVSVHCNASSESTKAHGMETFYRDENDMKLAALVQSHMSKWTGRFDRGIFRDVDYLNKHLAVLNGATEIPCCLVEIGYLSNVLDLEYIERNVRAIGDSLAAALHTFSFIQGGYRWHR